MKDACCGDADEVLDDKLQAKKKLDPSIVTIRPAQRCKKLKVAHGNRRKTAIAAQQTVVGFDGVGLHLACVKQAVWPLAWPEICSHCRVGCDCCRCLYPIV